MENSPIEVVFERYIQYSATAKGVVPVTIKSYRQTFSLVSNETSAKLIRDLTESVLEQMLIRVSSQRNWSAHSFFTHHRNLKAFYVWATARGYVDLNPMRNIARPRLPRAIPKALDEEQANQLIDAAYHVNWRLKGAKLRNRAIIATFIFAGLRRRELMNLKRGDVNLVQQQIFVQDGKGGRDRFIPINSRLLYFLNEYAFSRDNQSGDSIHFFQTLIGAKQLKTTGIKKMCNRLKLATGIHFTPHMLRHTFGTLTYRGCKDILAVSAMMGHTTVKTTQIYTHADSSDMRKAIEAHPVNF